MMMEVGWRFRLSEHEEALRFLNKENEANNLKGIDTFLRVVLHDGLRSALVLLSA